MKIEELYEKTPAARHQEIVISGDRLFFEGEEYILKGPELVLVRSQKGIEEKLAQIETRLGVS